MKLTLHSQDIFFNYVLEYIYNNYKEKIENIKYVSEKEYRSHDWEKNRETTKKIRPYIMDVDIIFNNSDINCKLINLEGNNTKYFNQLKGDGCSGYEILLQELILESDNEKVLIKLCDKSKEECEKKYNKDKVKGETIRLYYYRKDYWAYLSKIPKRDLTTINLKEGEIETLVEKLNNFIDDRHIYIDVGIPYKFVGFLHGLPGCGKTSTIYGIASHFNYDVNIIPLNKGMTDVDLVDAIFNINDNSYDRKGSKGNVIVIEDIDCIFHNRKDGDTVSGITLQGLLNCMDGLTCSEGTLLFLTANNPEALDDAMLRSCRIDYSLEYTYADKYQTELIYNKILPNQKDNFNNFYKLIKHKQYTPAMLQEFLFYNRRCENIIDMLEDFNKIIQKDYKKENKNIYN